MPSRHRPVTGLAMALALGLAACGGSAPASPSAAPSAVTATASPTTGATPSAAAATPSIAPAPSASASPSAAPSASASGGQAGTVSMVAAGDIARCDRTDDEDTGRLAASLPGAVALLGDIAYEDGSAKQLQDCFGPAWGGVQDRVRWAITGNHDIRTDGGQPMRDRFGDAAARDGKTYFSDEYGAWHVVVLDANCDAVDGGCGADSPQVRWLTADLAASQARCTLALWHQPRFSSGKHESAADVGAFWDALYAGGADLVLGGHEHDYERFAPQDPQGAPDAAKGITEIVVGTGGAPLRHFGDPIANSLVRIDDEHGVLALDLAPDGWTARFLATDGTTPDTSSGTCH